MANQSQLQLLKSINTKLDALCNIVPENNVSVNEVKKLSSIWQHMRTGWDGMPNSVRKPFWKPKNNLIFPEVMGLDGKPVRANEIMAQYMSKARSQFANDALPFNPLGGGIPLNQFQFNKLNQLLIDNVFLGYGELSMLTQNGLLNRICSVTSEEMCGEWIEFQGNDGDADADKIKELKVEFERLNVKQLMKWALYCSFVFGGCQVFPKLSGDEDYRDMPLEIDETMIGKGDLERIGVIEPIWYVPIEYNTIDPFDEWFYQPEYYAVMGQTVHQSRMWNMKYNPVVNLLKPVYLFNGMPLLQQCVPYVAKFENTYDQIVLIISRYNLSVLKTDQESIIDDSGVNNAEWAAANLKNRIEIFNTFRNNMSTLALAKDEEFQQVQMSLTGLDKLLSQSLELVAIIPGAPATKLFGGSPQGFNATGEFEMNNWYDRIDSLREGMMRDILIKIMHCAMLNIWGKIDDSITFNFKPLKQMNKLEQAQINLVKAQTDDVYINNGTLSQDDARTRLTSDEESGYDDIQATNDDFENEFTPENENVE